MASCCRIVNETRQQLLPAFCLIAVTECFQILIVSHRCDVTQICLIHFTLFGRSIHQLLRHDDAPCSDLPSVRSSVRVR